MTNPLIKTSVEFIRLKNSNCDSAQFVLNSKRRLNPPEMTFDRWHAFYKCGRCDNKIGSKIILEYNQQVCCNICSVYVYPTEQVSKFKSSQNVDWTLFDSKLIPGISFILEIFPQRRNSSTAHEFLDWWRTTNPQHQIRNRFKFIWILIWNETMS